MDRVRLRKAAPDDVATVLAFIRSLAEYERLSDECVATQEKLARTLFGEHKVADVLLAEIDGEAVGFALYYYHYSTFNAAPSLWLEDLFVDPSRRGSGVGKSLLKELCRIAQGKGCERVEWWVLDWNEASIKFYESIGAQPMSDWTVYRMDQDAIQSFVGA